MWTYEQLRENAKAEDTPVVKEMTKVAKATKTVKTVVPLEDEASLQNAVEVLDEWKILWEIIQGPKLANLMSDDLYNEALKLYQRTQTIVHVWDVMNVANELPEPTSLPKPYNDLHCANCWHPWRMNQISCKCGCKKSFTMGEVTK